MSSDAVPPTARYRILCVDDEPAIRAVLSQLLAREGHEVETAADGAEAWRRLEPDLARFDVVVTDNEMPNLTGFALVERLKLANFPGKIIAFSSSLSATMRARLASWAVTVVDKGSSTTSLLSAIRAATPETPATSKKAVG